MPDVGNFKYIMELQADNIIKKYIITNSIMDRVIKENIFSVLTIYGPPQSGKTHVISSLLQNLLQNCKGIHIASHTIANIDIYDEQTAFENLILFLKNTCVKNTLKIIILDDFDHFSTLFKKKISVYMSSHKIKAFCIIATGTGVENDINCNILPCIKCPLLESSDFKSNEIRTTIDPILYRNYTKTKNISSLINNQYMFSCVSDGINQHTLKQDYNFSDLILNEHMRVILAKPNSLTGLIDIVNEKYANNENIKDVVLLFETLLLDGNCDILYKDTVQYELKKRLLELCSSIKNKLVFIKTHNMIMNYKILFQYFIIELRHISTTN